METKKRAGTYVRVSSREQAGEDKASLEVQQRDCEAYCRRKGYHIVSPPYVDVQSGTDNRKERVAFEQMLEDTKRGLSIPLWTGAPTVCFVLCGRRPVSNRSWISPAWTWRR